jgi:hypothetical protein
MLTALRLLNIRIALNNVLQNSIPSLYLNLGEHEVCAQRHRDIKIKKTVPDPVNKAPTEIYQSPAMWCDVFRRV